MQPLNRTAVLVALLAALVAAAAASAGAIVVREGAPAWTVLEPVAPKPLPSHAEWNDAGAAPADATVRVVVAVRQRDSRLIEEACAAVSTPRSPRYGRYLSRDSLAALVGRPESARAVVQWLREQGVDDARVEASPAHDFVRAEVTADEAQRLFRASLRLKRHGPTGLVLPHAAAYAVPSHMADHVELVAGLTRLPNVRVGAGRVPQPAATATAATAAAAGSDDPVITPVFARQYYQYPSDLTDGSANTTAAVAEFPYRGAAESFVDEQFQAYLNLFGLPPASVTVRGDENLPGACPTSTGDQCVESMLDIETLAGFSGLKRTSFWITRTNGTLEHFLDWMSALAADSEPEHVQSVSFGDPERTFTPEYLNRCNMELAKLCARGVTVAVASGDCGVTDDCKKSSCTDVNADFPSSSPYSLAVGATQIKSSGEIVSSIDTGSRITSGGGFSVAFARPDYQVDAVASYVGSTTMPTYFNRSSFTRGLPDVSAVGHNYKIVHTGGTSMIDGTSASTPAVASMVAVVNAARARMGLPRVGFFNRVLYEDDVAATFSDVTQGSNECAEEFCCDPSLGYRAAPGWDAATGLGTPRVGHLINAINRVTGTAVSAQA